MRSYWIFCSNSHNQPCASLILLNIFLEKTKKRILKILKVSCRGTIIMIIKMCKIRWKKALWEWNTMMHFKKASCLLTNFSTSKLRGKKITKHSLLVFNPNKKKLGHEIPHLYLSQKKILKNIPIIEKSKKCNDHIEYHEN